jgi:hypothetical protein
MSPRRWSLVALPFVLALGAARADEPAGCPKRPAHDAGAVAPLFELLRIDRLDRLRADFTEEKHIALLAKPLRSTGQLFFERARGMARVTRSPAPERVTLTATTLHIEKGGKVEEVPLERSKSLRGFAVILPALLRGDRAGLEATFDLELEGSARESWKLSLYPKDAGLCGLLRRVVVSGQGPEVRALQVEETSGDVTDTRLSGTARNEAVPPAEIAKAFGAP